MTFAPAAGLSIGNSVGFDYNPTTPPSEKEQAASDEPSSSSSRKPEHYDAVIVGGGPAGLLSAIMMAQQQPLINDQSATTTSKKPRIIVYDRLPPPPPPDNLIYSTDISKYYLLGLGHRGQHALRHFGAWEDVERASVAVMGRRDWAPGKTKEEDSNIRMANKSVISRVLARDKLVGVLKKVIEEKYDDVVELRYGWQVDPVSFGNEKDIMMGEEELEKGSGPPVRLQVSRCIPVASSSGEEGGEECSIDDIDDAAPSTITTSFLIGSDGAARTIANAMEANDLKHRRNNNPLKRLFGRRSNQQLPFQVKRYEDDNPRVYKSIPIAFPSHWPADLNYSARSTDNRVTFEALPSDANGNYCALMLLRPDDPLAAANCDPKLLRQFYDEEFPQFSTLLGDDVMVDVATKGASSLPSFRYAGPRLHEGGRTVILGDCVHTVKPVIVSTHYLYSSHGRSCKLHVSLFSSHHSIFSSSFGLGANTALEDVEILSQILSNTPNLSDNLHNAVQEFTKQRAADSRALVTLSRGMDRPGKLGTMRFILPLIIDSMFNKIAPKVFAPGMFGMFQKEGIGFGQIQRRKRLDRVMQSMVILSAMSLLGVGLRFFVKNVARLLGVKDVVVGGSLVALLGAAGVARRIANAEEKQ
ncbi:hypothetical protein ACHAXR_010215 [Thalassiosira sp. AJA248-18]